MKTTQGVRTRTRLGAFIAALLLSVATLLLVATPAQAQEAYGTKILNASDWLNGAGVDVYANGSSSYVSNDYSAPAVGMKWQCVELVQRLYEAKGWHTGIFADVSVAADIWGQASNLGMTTQANGSINTIVPGDMIVHGYNFFSGAGHVAIVDSVVGSTVNVVEENFSTSGKASYSFSGGLLSRSGTTDIKGIVHDSDNQSAGPPPSAPQDNSVCHAANGLSALGGCPETYAIDANGDGLTDIVNINKNGVDTWLSTSWGNYSVGIGFKPLPGYGMTGCLKWVTGNFNADSKTDLACIWNSGVDVWFSNGDGTYAFNGTYGVSGYGMSGCNWVTGDFRGNGITDLACMWNGGVDVWFSNGNGTFTVHPTFSVPGYGMSGCKWLFGKFSPSNSRTGFACIWNGGADTWLSNGDGTFTVSSTFLPWSGYNMTAGFYWKVVNVTGTNVDSLLYFWNGGIDTWTPNGNGTFGVTTQAAPAGYTMQGGDWQFGDFNGDGKKDIVNVNKNGVDTWLSNGQGYYNVAAVSQKPAGYNMTAGIEFRVGRVTNTTYDSLMHVWSGGVNTWFAYGSTGTWSVAGPYSVSGYTMTEGRWY